MNAPTGSERMVLTRKFHQEQDTIMADCLPQNPEHEKPVFLGVGVDMYTYSLTNHGVLKIQSRHY